MNRLREARKERGMTQYRLSERSGVSIRTITYIERHDRPPHYPTRKRLLKALGMQWSQMREIWPRGT